MRESFHQMDPQVDKGNTDVLNTDALSVEIVKSGFLMEELDINH